MVYTYPFKYVDLDTKLAVWQKGKPIPGRDSHLWRSDICGRVIRFTDHGDTDSEYGWEIDHIKPVALGGTHELSNLQPLHWANNLRKGDNYPWHCS